MSQKVKKQKYILMKIIKKNKMMIVMNKMNKNKMNKMNKIIINHN